MEKTKLTIRVTRDLLEGAKSYAIENNTTLTRLVSEYLRRLTVEKDALSNAPTVQRLSGILSQDVSVEDYREYLELKYDRQV
jgi:hypothetical protein